MQFRLFPKDLFIYYKHRKKNNRTSFLYSIDSKTVSKSFYLALFKTMELPMSSVSDNRLMVYVTDKSNEFVS